MNLVLASLFAFTFFAAAAPSPDIFTPDLAVGEVLSYHEVLRTSGTLGVSREHVTSSNGSARVLAAGNDGYRFAMSVQDGRNVGEQTIAYTARGDILGPDQRPISSHFLIAPLYDRFFFGTPPTNLALGTSWTVQLAPWQLGPAGTATVTVTAFEPAAKTLELSAVGSGDGPLSAEPGRRTSISDGTHQTYADSVPLHSKWTAKARLVGGVVVAESATVQTQWRVAASALSASSTYVETHSGELKLVARKAP